MVAFPVVLPAQAPAPSERLVVFGARGRVKAHPPMGPGPAWTYTGGPEGDRWIFNTDRPNNSQRIRQVITPSQDRIRFVEESSKDNGPWETTEDYTMVKVK